LAGELAIRAEAFAAWEAADPGEDFLEDDAEYKGAFVVVEVGDAEDDGGGFARAGSAKSEPRSQGRPARRRRSARTERTTCSRLFAGSGSRPSRRKTSDTAADSRNAWKDRCGTAADLLNSDSNRRIDARRRRELLGDSVEGLRYGECHPCSPFLAPRATRHTR
jgi:hypothetical protein